MISFKEFSMEKPNDDESLVAREYTIGGVSMGREGLDPFSDVSVRERVRHTLDHSSALNASAIEVIVHDGVVTLMGQVDSESAIHVAELTIEGLQGVKRVVNELQVQSTVESDDDGAKNRFELF